MSTMPKRLQRRRTRGWRMPPGAIYVGRPTKFGNPYPSAAEFRWGMDWARFQPHRPSWMRSVEWRHLRWILEHLGELRGRDLVCWCPLDQPCHADVLLQLANRPEAAMDERRKERDDGR